MTKSELIAALKDLSEKLGRPLSTEGNVAELEARLAEAQAEAGLLDDEQDGEIITQNHPQKESDQNHAPASSSGSGDRRFIRVLHALDVFHYPAGRSLAVRAIIQPGEVIELSTDDAAACIAAGHAEDA